MGKKKTKIKTFVKLVGTALLAILLYSTWEIFSSTKFDKPTGSYPVGTLGVEITDSTRKEDALSDTYHNMRLLLQFWYPAKDLQNGFGPFIFDQCKGNITKIIISKHQDRQVGLKTKINLRCRFITTFIGKAMLPYNLCVRKIMRQLIPGINSTAPRS